MKLNEYQRSAVEERPANITVSAAAGSGKTQVLGARVLERITGNEAVDVNRLLIVTFTRAAASEMRSRIGASIAEALRAETDPERRRRLERQSALLGGADICTVDSFCYRLLKQNFFRIPGLPGDFTVGDEEAVGELCAEAFKDIVEMFSAALAKIRGEELIPAYAEKAERFYELYPDETRAGYILNGFNCLVMNYGSPKRAGDFSPSGRRQAKNPDYISLVYIIKRGVETAPSADAWLDGVSGTYTADSFDSMAISRFAAEAAEGLRCDIASMLCRELEGGLNSAGNTAAFERAFEAVTARPVPKTYSDAHAMFRDKPFQGIRITSKDSARQKGDPHAGTVMARARKLWDEGAALFRVSSDEIDIFRKEAAPAVVAAVELTRCLLREERRLCMEKKTLSFSVCVRLALELLTNEDGSPSQTALELRELYDEIYVDEAQDVDPRQLAIFNALSKGALFMVGDVKQSIYSFRHAQPEIFNDRCENKDENSRLISMNINYRSNSAIIDTVNAVFERLINRGTMGTDYSSMHKMLHGEDWLVKDAPQPEFIAVVDEDKNAKRYDFELEAQAVANKIKELLASKTPVYDKTSGEIRPIMKKDIIVLMRAVHGDGPVMSRVLEDNGIDCYFDGGQGLYSKGEISAVLDVLTLIDNDERDIPLAGTLRGVMFGFTENDLLAIRAVSMAHSFSSVFRALSDPSNSRHEEYARRLGNDALLSRCLDFGSKLRRWRNAADFRPVSEVIDMIINETGFYSSVGGMKGSAGRANLDALTDAAERFEASGARGLYAFLCRAQRQSLAPTPSVLEAKTLSESMDVVRIMSIHKSKGLEAPVVILMKCSKPMRFGGGGAAVSLKLGFSMDYVNEDGGYYHSSPLSRLIDFENRSRERCEEIRLMYVAMTRPRERLICTGYFPSEKAFESINGFEGEVSKSEAVFMADSYAKLLGRQVTDGSCFSLTLLRPGDIASPSLWERLEGGELNGDAAEGFANLLGFSAKYPYRSDIPAKVSVSALKAKGKEDDEDAAKLSYEDSPQFVPLRAPAFMKADETVSAAELGTAYHTVMERLDFERNAAVQLDEMLSGGIISEAEHKLIVAERIQALLDSPLGMRMRSAKRLFREAPFMINLPASELGLAEDAPPDETVAVQGIIDCYFLEGDKVVLVDYKTDQYDNPRNIAEKYKKQLYYYSKAINLKFSDKKIEKYLYLFFKGDIIEV